MVAGAGPEELQLGPPLGPVLRLVEQALGRGAAVPEAPEGGQRGLVVSPPKAGKTLMLQNIAQSIASNHPECYLIVLLIDERPEEVTEMEKRLSSRDAVFDPIPEGVEDDRIFSPAAFLPAPEADPPDAEAASASERVAAGLREWAREWRARRRAIADLLLGENDLNGNVYRLKTIEERWLPDLDLLAQRLDLDALDLVLPESEQDDGGAGPALRLRLSAEEVVRGGVTARGVVMSLGDDPDCRRPSG